MNKNFRLLSEALEWFAKPPSLRTVRRWATKGLNGVYLQTKWTARGLAVTKAYVEKFEDEVAVARRHRRPILPTRTYRP